MNFTNEIYQEKSPYRKLERIQTKFMRNKYSILFNKTCLKENYLINVKRL